MTYKFILSFKSFLICNESMNDNDPQPIKLPQALLKPCKITLLKDAEVRTWIETRTTGVKSSHML